MKDSRGELIAVRIENLYREIPVQDDR